MVLCVQKLGSEGSNLSFQGSVELNRWADEGPDKARVDLELESEDQIDSAEVVQEESDELVGRTPRPDVEAVEEDGWAFRWVQEGERV